MRKEKYIVEKPLFPESSSVENDEFEQIFRLQLETTDRFPTSVGCSPFPRVPNRETK